MSVKYGNCSLVKKTATHKPSKKSGDGKEKVQFDYRTICDLFRVNMEDDEESDDTTELILDDIAEQPRAGIVIRIQGRGQR